LLKSDLSRKTATLTLALSLVREREWERAQGKK